MKPSEVLRDAMKHVEAGWCKGQYDDNKGNVCAVGALRKVAAQEDVCWDVYVTAGSRMIQFLGYEGSMLDIVDWNDSIATTKQDVLHAMEKTAIQCEEHGE
jgi:hypothetical protein